MKAKYFAAAAAFLIASGASAQSPVARPHQAGATARHAVLDNIMSRVQMDALIGTIVETEAQAPTRLAADAVAAGNTRSVRERRAVAYAALTSPAVRERS